MKNTKNLILMIFVSVCSFLLVGVMNVSAQIGFKNSPPVCTPDNVKPGEKVTCYIVGAGTQADSTSSTTPSAQETAGDEASPGQQPLPAPVAEVGPTSEGTPQPTADGGAEDGKTHGFVTRLYTTDGLMFDSVEPYIQDTSAVALEATAQSDSSKKEITIGSKKIDYTCTYYAGKAPKAEWQIGDGDDFRCALFYGNTETPSITVKSGVPPTEIQGLTGTGNGIMVIGKVITHISDDVDAGSSCGELCVLTKEAATVESYTNTSEGSEDYVCAEVHYTKDGTPASNVETGAFTSYFLLAAGALIAISAIAIAKKNNKFYRV